MRTRNLTYVIALAEEKNFSRAAERLYISQPALSKIISNLESELGTPLFDRNANPMRLTPAGEIYVRAARDIVRREESLYKEVQDLSDTVTGTIRVGCTLPISDSVMPLVLPSFIQKYPGVSVRLVEGSSRDRMADLTNGRIDAMIGGANPGLREIETFTVGSSRRLIVAPKNYVPGLSDAPCMEEAAGLLARGEYRYILHPEGYPGRAVADRFFRQFRIVPRIAVEMRMPLTALQLASQGTGITFMPAHTFVEFRNVGALEQTVDICPMSKDYDVDIDVHVPKHVYRTKALRCFIDTVAQEFQKLRL